MNALDKSMMGSSFNVTTSGKPAKLVNHWGKWVDSSIPTTGVYGFNQVSNWLWEEESIDLTYESFLDELRREGLEEDSDKWQNACDMYESFESDLLIGAWMKDSDGKYIPDPAGEYSAIINGSMYTIQVVLSKHIGHGNLCSPCYPGQVDAGSEGQFSYYALPDDLLYKDN